MKRQEVSSKMKVAQPKNLVRQKQCLNEVYNQRHSTHLGNRN